MKILVILVYIYSGRYLTDTSQGTGKQKPGGLFLLPLRATHEETTESVHDPRLLCSVNFTELACVLWLQILMTAGDVQGGVKLLCVASGE